MGMNVLGLDCATTGCSVALMRDGKIVAASNRVMDRGQAEVLNAMMGDVMAKADTGFKALDRIGVTVGPGSFTGVRIGLAVARALGLGLGIPVVGVTTFAAFARAVPKEERVGRNMVIAVNGKRRDVFVQTFDEACNPISEPDTIASVANDALPSGQMLIAGDGSEILRNLLMASKDMAGEIENRIRFSSRITPPDAAHVAAMAAEMAEMDAPELTGKGASVRPLYIRPPDAALPTKSRRRS